MQLLKSIFKGIKSQNHIPEALHASIMAHALQPDFFGEGKTPDTFAGRFEIVSLHAAIVFRRLRELGDAGKELSQATFKELFSGFDDALREMGTGDLRVGKKVRQIGESFYGRAKAYDEALNSDDMQACAAALERNIGVNEDFAVRLANYAKQLDAALKTQSAEALLQGKVDWVAAKTVDL